MGSDGLLGVLIANENGDLEGASSAVATDTELAGMAFGVEPENKKPGVTLCVEASLFGVPNENAADGVLVAPVRGFEGAKEKGASAGISEDFSIGLKENDGVETEVVDLSSAGLKENGKVLLEAVGAVSLVKFAAGVKEKLDGLGTSGFSILVGAVKENAGGLMGVSAGLKENVGFPDEVGAASGLGLNEKRGFVADVSNGLSAGTDEG